MTDLPCGHETSGVVCGATPTRKYLIGQRCADHTPARLAGRPDLVPDPDRTLDALRARRGITFNYRPNDSAVLDQKAVASSTGRRPKSAAEYKLAREAEEQRKQQRRQSSIGKKGGR